MGLTACRIHGGTHCVHRCYRLVYGIKLSERATFAFDCSRIYRVTRNSRRCAVRGIYAEACDLAIDLDRDERSAVNRADYDAASCAK
jgi:hypothetical protein